MEYFILVLPFIGDDILLIDSGRFPGKFNGIGGKIPNIEVSFYECVDHFMKIETGINTTNLTKQLAVIYSGKDFKVWVYRIDVPADDSLINHDDCIHPDRDYTKVTPENAFFYRDDLAPNLPALIAMAAENSYDVFEFSDNR